MEDSILRLLSSDFLGGDIASANWAAFLVASMQSLVKALGAEKMT
tara:strand:+ start:154 stop:288 length:135 start_codon:yes stop_codon:yes gene_type:complete